MKRIIRSHILKFYSFTGFFHFFAVKSLEGLHDLAGGRLFRQLFGQAFGRAYEVFRIERMQRAEKFLAEGMKML